MEQGRPFTTGNSGDGGDDARSEGNPPWKKGKKNFSLSEFIEKRWKIIVGVCVLLIVLALVIMPENKPPVSEDARNPLEGKISVLASRLDKIESRLTGLELAATAPDSQNLLKSRIDEFESAFNLKLDELTKKMEQIQSGYPASDSKRTEPKKTVDSEPSKPAAVTTTAPKKTAEPQKVTAAKHQVHTVEKGDTLYSISRRYKVKVEDICQANNITPSTVINLGQKLKIFPPK